MNFRLKHFAELILGFTFCAASGWSEEPGIGAVMFERDVAPIIRDRCAGCHRPGQSGPFSLLTRNDVILHASTIQAVIDDGYMPPWKPVPTGVTYANDRRLVDDEKALINQWIDQVASLDNELDSTDRQSVQAVRSVVQSDWSLGTPDMVVRMRHPFTVPADGPDLYRSFVMPLALPEDRWIKAMELRPTARGAVHHALFFVDPDGKARARSNRDGQTGFSGMSFLIPSASGLDAIAKNMNRGLGGYVPGATPNRLPGDLARKLPAGSDIVMQTHFHPIGREVIEQAELGIHFAKQPSSQRIIPIQVPALFGIGAGIDIPPGDDHYVVTQTYELPVDVEAIEVGGHAHYVCESMKMSAHRPDGSQMNLLRIDSWDLDWQDQYQFSDRMALPKGTKLQVQIVYDNSDANPANPYSPPRRIQWGRESNDEMGSMVVHVVATSQEDCEILEQHLEQFTLASLRRRINARTQMFGRLGRFKPGPQLLLTLFDRNKDGALQATEIPSAYRSNLMDFFDLDLDQTLSPAELKRARQLYTKLMETNEDS
ncbi:hypothetical protein [Neorhodopirellula lusitana]|uniref:hypothetical protein n=1 Tax=Neorhodopirellula lusitana TaxID=445327 RepID=UPI00384ECA6F